MRLFLLFLIVLRNWLWNRLSLWSRFIKSRRSFTGRRRLRFRWVFFDECLGANRELFWFSWWNRFWCLCSDLVFWFCDWVYRIFSFWLRRGVQHVIHFRLFLILQMILNDLRFYRVIYRYLVFKDFLFITIKLIVKVHFYRWIWV